MRKRTGLGLAGAAAAATIAVGAFALGDRSLGDGPLDGPMGVGYGGPAAIGQVFSAGLADLSVEGDKPAVIESVRVLGLTGPIDFLGVRTRLLPSQEGNFLGDNGFPPPKYPAKPLSEQNVVPVVTNFSEKGNPLDALQLLIGIKVTGPGIAKFRAVEVTYKVGDRRYREVYETFTYLCAPESVYPVGSPTCPGEDEDVFDDRSAVATA